MEYAIVGVSHHNASIELRERLAVAADTVPATLTAAQTRYGGEWMILSTCNRVECLLHGVEGDVAMAAGDVLSRASGVAVSEFRDALRVLRGDDAVCHAFRVAAGLDSMVLGEPQVLGQWKAAFQCAVDSGTAGTFLTRLGQRTLQTAKRVRSDTEIGRYATSLSSLAVTLAQEIFEPLAEKHVLVLGAGEMAELAVVHFRERGVAQLAIANRTRARAERLAAEYGAAALAWEDWPEALAAADIVLVGAGAEGHLLGADEIKAAVRGAAAQPRMVVDLAVPRAVDPAVADLRDVFLYSVDDLEALSRANRERRAGEAERAEAMIADAVTRFGAWYEEQQWAPLLAEFSRWLEAVRGGEVARTLAAAPSDAREAADAATAAVTKRIVQALAQQLKAGGGDAERVARTLALLAPGDARDDDDDETDEEHAVANRLA